jgi:uncharacterized membrane protein YphA (DoxX/SURF4 family)
MNISERVDHWMFDAYALDVRSLGLARIIVGVYVVLYRPTPLRWMRDLPDSFFRPPAGPLRLLDGIPSSGFLTVVSAGLCVAAVALLLGFHTRVASAAAGLLLFVVDGLSYSFGHIHHSGTFLAALLVIMAASDWGAAYSVDALRRSERTGVGNGWPIALAAMLLAGLMLTATLPKLGTGWLDPSSLAARAQVVHQHFTQPGQSLLGDLPLHWTSAWAWKPFDYVTVLLEAGFIVAVASPRAFRVFCAAAVLFHLAIFVAFGIDFTANVAAYAVFFEWSMLVDRLEGAELRARARAVRSWLASRRAWIVVGVLGLAGALAVIADHVGAPVVHVANRFSTRPNRVAVLLVFAIAVPLAVGYLAVCARNAFRPRAMRSGVPLRDGVDDVSDVVAGERVMRRQ